MTALFLARHLLLRFPVGLKMEIVRSALMATSSYGCSFSQASSDPLAGLNLYCAPTMSAAGNAPPFNVLLRIAWADINNPFGPVGKFYFNNGAA